MYIRYQRYSSYNMNNIMISMIIVVGWEWRDDFSLPLRALSKKPNSLPHTLCMVNDDDGDGGEIHSDTRVM